MANVGTAAPGKTLIGTGNGTSPTFASIGTNSGLTTHGVLIGQGNGAFTATSAGSNGQILQSKGAGLDPAYTTATYPATAGSIGTILQADGNNWIPTTSTYPSTTAQGDILYASAANTLSTLAKNITATRYLSNTGTSNNPAWAQVNVANGVTGVLGPTNGGTGNSGAPSAGQLLIGNGTSGVYNRGTLTQGTGITITNADGSVTVALSTPVSLANGGTNANLTASNGGIFYSTATAGAILAGTSTANQVLLSGSSTTPAWSTATYPGTTTASQILYSSSNNTIAGLSTANSGVLATNSSGVPSIDTTNFAVLSTGLQLKGNNTNTAPPAGFIGEQIRSAVASGSAISLTNNVAANVTSISLTAGIWDVNAVGSYNISATFGGTVGISINTTSATTGNLGDNYLVIGQSGATALFGGVTIPSYRLTLSGTTTVYLVAIFGSTAGTCSAYGRISATRVG